jgi:hypothetical protein
MFSETFGRGSLKDYCPLSIVKEEADWEYTRGVLAQEVYSLYLNNTLELNLYTMENIVFEFVYNGKHCIWIQYIIYSILCIICNILYILYYILCNLLYIIYCLQCTVYYI